MGVTVCKECKKEFVQYAEGGITYCSNCQTGLRKRYMKKYRLIQLGEIRHARSRMAVEVMWNWACPICGLKHKTEKSAARCCEAAVVSVLTQPIYCSGGYLVWRGETIPLAELNLQPTTSRSRSTTTPTNSPAIAVAV